MESPNAGEVVSKLLSRLGYVTESIDVSGKCVTLNVKSIHRGVEEATLVELHLRKAKLDKSVLEKTMKKIEGQNIRKALIFSTSDFSKNAIAYAFNKPIDLIDSADYKRLLVKYNLAPGKPEKEEKMFVYESSFKRDLPQQDALKFFESRRKRMLILLGNPAERVSEISGRLTPAAKVTAMIDGETRSVFINLHTGVLYYVRRDLLKKKRVLEEVELLESISDLDDDAITLLGEIVRASEIPLSSFGLKTNLTVQEKIKIIVRLKARKLIDVIGKGEPTFLSNINLPDLKERRFDLEDFYETEENLKTDFEADEIRYNTDDLIKKMALFFGGNIMLERVMYLPYYRGVFIDSKSRVRYESIPALKEKNM